MTAGFPDFVRQKICARCGTQFGCGPQALNETCWCDALPHIVAVSEGADCFCPNCLETIVSAAQVFNNQAEARGSR